MSPEQVKSKPLDGRSDQFSLAVIVYLLLTGERPFSGDNEAAVFHQILHDDPDPPSEVNPALPQAVDRVLLRALAKDPAKRYPTCAELAAELAAALAGQPATKVLRLGPLLGWIAAGLAVLVLGALTLWKKPAPADPTIPSSPPAVVSAPLRASPSPPPPALPTPSPSPPQEVAVEITSESGSCRVRIDGRHTGFTPLSVSLAPGPHEITCEWPGSVRRRLTATVTTEQRRFKFRR
jgi:serine/threonine-protein kinase